MSKSLESKPLQDFLHGANTKDPVRVIHVQVIQPTPQAAATMNKIHSTLHKYGYSLKAVTHLLQREPVAVIPLTFYFEAPTGGPNPPTEETLRKSIMDACGWNPVSTEMVLPAQYRPVYGWQLKCNETNGYKNECFECFEFLFA